MSESGASGLFQWQSAAEGELQAVVNAAMLAGVLAADRAVWITGEDPIAAGAAAVDAYLTGRPSPPAELRFDGLA